MTGTVTYQWSSSMKRMGRISDPRMLAIVKKIADKFGNVTVVSGDRDFVQVVVQKRACIF